MTHQADRQKAERFIAHLEPIQRQLTAYCSRALLRPSESFDVLQSAVANAFRDFDKYSEGSNFRAWMFRYVTLETLNHNRLVYIYLDPKKLESYGLSLMDVQQAIKTNNLMIPTRTAKINDIDYMVDMANMIENMPEFDNIIVKVIDGRPIYVRDVGHVEDASAIQTNIVRISRSPAWDSKRQVYVPIFRRPGANTIDVVNGVRERIPEFLGRLPNKDVYVDPDTNEPASGLHLDVVADQSVFVRKAISNLTKEGILGAALASLMVLLFIGCFRLTLIIALAIPLSALVAIIGLYFTGNTLNAMTLGGLALVMGRLVDDPLIDIENTFRHLDMGKSPILGCFMIGRPGTPRTPARWMRPCCYS